MASPRTMVDPTAARTPRQMVPEALRAVDSTRTRIVAAFMTMALATVGCAWYAQGNRGAHAVTPGVRRFERMGTAAVAPVGSLEESPELGSSGEEEAEEQICSELPSLTFDMPDSVTRSNLGMKGPSFNTSEGIVYRMIAHSTIPAPNARGASEEMYVVVHAVTPSQYKPANIKMNGMEGNVAFISIDAGSEVDLVFRFYDKHEYDLHGEEASHYKLPKVALTILDMDTAKTGSQEYVIAQHFTDYFMPDQTTVMAKQQADGRMRFSATADGTISNNPKDPRFLTEEQRNEAVTLSYENTDHIKLTAGVGVGKFPRSLMFAFEPALQCATAVPSDNYKPPLPDIKARGPMEVALRAQQNEEFEGFIGVKEGAEVQQGQGLALVQHLLGTTHTYLAPCEGTICKMQTKLHPGDNLDLALGDKTFLVICKPHLPPLQLGGDVVGGGPGLKTGMDDFATFVKYLVRKGDPVHKGDPIAVAMAKDGTTFNLLATGYGTVHEMQEDLDDGDYVLKVKDAELISLKKFTELGPVSNNNAVAASFDETQRGMTFETFHVSDGDTIKTGDAVCTVMNDEGEQVVIRATTGGFVTALQSVEEGTPLDRVDGMALVTVGMFPELQCTSPEETPVKYTQVTDHALGDGGCNDFPCIVDATTLQFERYHVKVGDLVEDGHVIATLKDATLHTHELVADRPGQVSHLLPLKEGMFLQRVMQGETVATIGPLPPLSVHRYERSAAAPISGEWIFEKWFVKVGDEVRRNDPIALLRNRQDGKTRMVRAEKSGAVDSRQEHLRIGDIVEEVTQDDVLATIGKFQEPKMTSEEVSAEVPSLDCTFDFWLVRKGESVKEKDPIAQVTCVQRRRLRQVEGPAAFRRLKAGEMVQILAPASGTINYLPDLTPGETIRSQSTSRHIATVSKGGSNTTAIIVVAVVGLLLFGALFAVVQSRKSGYTTVASAE